MGHLLAQIRDSPVELLLFEELQARFAHNIEFGILLYIPLILFFALHSDFPPSLRVVVDQILLFVNVERLVIILTPADFFAIAIVFIYFFNFALIL